LIGTVVKNFYAHIYLKKAPKFGSTFEHADEARLFMLPEAKIEVLQKSAGG